MLAAIDWLCANGFARVHLVGHGWGSISAAFAAALDDRVCQVTLKHAPFSFAGWATAAHLAWPHSCCPPGILGSLDLAEVYRELLGKSLQLIQPWDAEMRPLARRPAMMRLRELGLPEGILG